MSESKQDNSITQFLNINSDMPILIGNQLTVKEESRLLQVSKHCNQFFQGHFNKRTEPTYVVEGNVIQLIKSVSIDPSWLFKKHPVIRAPHGQKYFDVSYYQLMTFLCDDDMKTQTMALDNLVEYLKDNAKKAIKEKQYAEIDCGGADLIKLDRNPLELNFEALTHFKRTYTFYDNTQHEVTHSLLENTDGIFCYSDENENKHFYYVNQITQTILSLDKYLIPEESKGEFEQFKASFDDMENNSGRRSSIKEHQLIAKVFGLTLVQKGILYEHHGIKYRDYRTPFNIINAYRKCVRLYLEAENNNNWEAGHQCWRNKVGKSQGEEVWLLQRICEENRPFYPLDKKHKDFKRKCMIEKYNNDKKKYEMVSVLENGTINMFDFAIYKGSAVGT